MSIILNIETSSTNCSVSISEEGKLVDFVEQNFDQYSHSKSLHVFIDKLFKKTEIPLGDLTAVSISEGPGSYTGLRIGVSAAKGICFALDIPLIAIDTMYILARKIECSKGYIISAMDARRDEIYYSIFEFNNNKLPKRIVETDSLVLNSNSFHKFLKSSTVNFIGNSNEKIMNFIDHKNAIFSDFSLPSAKEMGILSHLKFIKKDFVDISEFQPKYLKEFGGKKIKN